MKHLFALVFIAFLLTSCGDLVGHECKLRSGALGFGFDDDCKTKCLQLHKVVCPDQTIVQKAVCAGAEGCEPGSCEDGEICYSFEDPIEKYFYCIPADYCGVTLKPQETRDWENASRERSDTIRADFSEKMKRRKTHTSTATPTVEAPTIDTPVVVVKEPVQIPANTHILIESWGYDMAPVLCVSNGSVKTGSDCIEYLPAGVTVEHGGSRVRSTGSKQLECAAMQPVAGVGGEPLGTSEHSGQRWGWVPSAPKGFAPTALQSLDPALLAVAKTVIPNVSQQTQIELAATADFDGNGALERIVRVFEPSSDIDKPGNTTLWVVDEARMYRLPEEGLELNGVQNVRGVLPLKTGGSLLIFTSDWMGGSATHAIGPKNGRLVPIAELACGS